MIDRRLAGDRQAAGDEAREEGRAGRGDGQAQQAPDGSQRQALGDELPDESLPPRAQRGPHRHLAGPMGAAREEQAGEVGAGQEQDA